MVAMSLEGSCAGAPENGRIGPMETTLQRGYCERVFWVAMALWPACLIGMGFANGPMDHALAWAALAFGSLMIIARLLGFALLAWTVLRPVSSRARRT